MMPRSPGQPTQVTSHNPHLAPDAVIVAPMAGITDQPFRNLCRVWGAKLVVSEMIHADVRLWHRTKSRNRLRFDSETGTRWVQIAGAEPLMLAEAARCAEDAGADVIDINMGCPVKKVCKLAAGSALMRNEPLIARILAAVVAAVDVPVTLKTRLGWSRQEMNGAEVAHIAENEGVSLVTIHGRTRACRFKGEADYPGISAVRDAVDIPVVANGDITTIQRALAVRARTGCERIMIGRGMLGRPWFAREVAAAIAGETFVAPGPEEIRGIMLGHVDALHHFYGERLGVPIARKHVGWFLERLPGSNPVRAAFNRLPTADAQLDLIRVSSLAAEEAA